MDSERVLLAGGKKFPYRELEVAGFNGQILPLAFSDQALPILHHKPTGLYLNVDESDSETPMACARQIPERQVELWESEGRWTRLPRPIRAFPGVLVLYVKQSLLNELGDDAVANSGYVIEWDELHFKGNVVKVACVSAELADQTLIGWAERLRDRSFDRLVDYFRQNSESHRREAENLAEMALSCAGNRRSLVQPIYLRLALAIHLSHVPERMKGLRLAVKKRYPNWQSTDFDQEVRELENDLRGRASSQLIPSATSDSSELTRDNASAVSDAKWISAIADEDAQVKEALEAAKRHTTTDEIGDDEQVEALGRIDQNSRFPLNDKLVRLLKANPAFYCHDVLIVDQQKRPILKVQMFLLWGVRLMSFRSGSRQPKDPVEAYIASAVPER